MRTWNKVALTLGLLCVAFGSVTSGEVADAAHANTTVFVSVSSEACSDGVGAGGEATPFCTIQAAADHADAGDTVSVAAGVYEERFTVTTPGLKLRGANAGLHGSASARGPESRVNGDLSISGSIGIKADGVVVDGFEFDKIDYGIQVLDSNDLVITNSRILGSGEFGIALTNSDSSVITRNHIEENGSIGLEILNGSAVLRFNNIFDNGSASFPTGVRRWIEVGHSPGVVDARYNWWGAESGPGGEGPGTGDAVTVDVVFEPWCTTPAPDCESESDRFVDDDDSIFENDMEWLAEQGITKGCNPPLNTKFCPDDPVTRGQMAAFLNRALNLDPGPDTFTDTGNSVFTADIGALAAAGVTRGCNPPANDEFCPGDSVTRGQIAAFLVRAFGYSDDGGGDRFVDDNGSVFEGEIDRLGTAGVTRGCNPPTNDRFCPGEPVTRGQMAAFIHRALGD